MLLKKIYLNRRIKELYKWRNHQIFHLEKKLWKLDLKSETILKTFYKKVLNLQRKKKIKIKQLLKNNLKKKINIITKNPRMFYRLLIKGNLNLINLAKLSKKMIKIIKISRYNLRKYLN